MHNLKELEVLHNNELDNLLAKLIGADQPIIKWKFSWRISPKFQAWNEYPGFRTKELAEIARNEEIQSGCEVTDVEGYELPAIIEQYTLDLNACHAVEMEMFKSYETHEGAERLSFYTKLLCRLKHPLFADSRQRTIALIISLQKP